MLTGRLVIDYQLKRKQEPPTTGNGEIRTEEKVRKVEWMGSLKVTSVSQIKAERKLTET